MKRIEVVPANYVYHVWDRVEPFLTRGLAKSGGEYTAEHIKMYLTRGEQTLVIIIDDASKIHGAISLHFNNYPNSRVAFVTSIGGKMIADKDLWAQFENWLRQTGVTAVRGAAYESVARLWRKTFGMETRYIIVEKKL
jgi:hypothetical protein